MESWGKGRVVKTFIEYLSESKLEKHADHFVDYCCDELGIKNKPEIKFVNSKIQAKMNTSFGGYYPGEKKIKVNTAGRHVVDVFRTLAHELVHHKQNEDERLDADSGKTGSEIENEANSKAGILLRNYGKAKPELFESKEL
jgi:Zn-dependent peptidase ImmA (M78 family)